MMKTLILVACGGAIGASLRYLWGVFVFRLVGGGGEFPLAVMTANIIGSFLMGIFVVLAAQKGFAHYAPFVAVGILGGFTTFSAFSLETVNLIEQGAFVQAGVYVLGSVLLSVAALMAGLLIMRSLLA